LVNTTRYSFIVRRIKYNLCAAINILLFFIFL
jgi:hypothetical protein